MRAAGFAVLAGIVFLSSCGYVGPVVPPSPELPQPVTNLNVVERGDQLLLTFDVPARTTDNLAIKRFSEIDLRIGSSPMPFDLEHWAASARAYQLSIPPPNDPDDPKPHPIAKTLPAADWTGQRIAVLVRTAVKQHDRFSQWSNRVVLQVVPPIAAPELQAKAVKPGFLLTWTPPAPGLEYQIFRQDASDKMPVLIGTTDTSPFVDQTSHWDTPYVYTVVAQKGSAESLASKPVRIESADIFPPEIPASITAVAGPDSVEVSWSRSPDADTKGYYVYRQTGAGPFERQNGLLTLPTFSDHNVQHGHTYRYAVSAVDQKGNESNKLKPAEIAF